MKKVLFFVLMLVIPHISMAQPRDIFDEECVVTEKAFELAQVRQEIDRWIGQKEGAGSSSRRIWTI
ncbi:hypothetical protein [Kerstersia gyiorum]|uniref:hypothetical protein n=1 Tax=Kerstersia gyiorum TaxID=206506 RepID=UPI0030CAFC2B